MLDWLDDLVGPEKALIARTGLERRQALKVCAFATGLADKAVSLVYERAIHQRSTPIWLERCRTQVAGVLDALEADRAARTGDWWFGERIGHADVAVGCTLRFVGEAHPEVFHPEAWPALAAHAARCEALPVFQAVSQPFTVTLPAAS
jgi:glutathione S-transferase